MRAITSTLALLLRSDLRSARDRHFEDRLELGPSGDFAADVADDPTEPAAQQAMVALELLGMGIARTTTPELKFSVHTHRDNRRGIPQGAPISPLLANLYMRRFVLGWKMLGLEQRLGSRIVTYADDRVPRNAPTQGGAELCERWR